MTDPRTIKLLVTAFIAEINPSAGEEFLTLTDDYNFLEGGYLDSSGFVDLLNLLEQKTGIIPDLVEADPAELGSVNGLVQYYCSADA